MPAPQAAALLAKPQQGLTSVYSVKSHILPLPHPGLRPTLLSLQLTPCWPLTFLLVQQPQSSRVSQGTDSSAVSAAVLFLHTGLAFVHSSSAFLAESLWNSVSEPCLPSSFGPFPAWLFRMAPFPHGLVPGLVSPAVY